MLNPSETRELIFLGWILCIPPVRFCVRQCAESAFFGGVYLDTTRQESCLAGHLWMMSIRGIHV